MRVLLRPSDHHNRTKCITQSIQRMVVSQSTFPLELAIVYEELPQNCLLGAADLNALCFSTFSACSVLKGGGGRGGGGMGPPCPPLDPPLHVAG